MAPRGSRGRDPVTVVGAGPNGLGAAVELARAGHRAIVREAMDYAARAALRRLPAA